MVFNSFDGKEWELLLFIISFAERFYDKEYIAEKYAVER